MSGKRLAFNAPSSTSAECYQDMADDVKAGVKSSALLFGRKNMKAFLSIFASITVAAWTFAGYLNSQGPAFYIISVIGSAIHIIWQITSVNIDSPEDCGSKFVVRVLFCCLIFPNSLGQRSTVQPGSGMPVLFWTRT